MVFSGADSKGAYSRDTKKYKEEKSKEEQEQKVGRERKGYGEEMRCRRGLGDLGQESLGKEESGPTLSSLHT